ncbi:TMhelix containing protein [Vibrio phage 1.188.A._10N.286.51.A6]|uniref:TMhelix containing protein n=6 Tax=Mukerjeevirus TaxID=2733146 RepID=A0A2I7REG9_9CAUD|nr:TMhelix containing protein [Vibrio phage 1.169.O._10N.261.52.B1]YP_009817468.1 TMhelix containing protein [Vibrio phage 1.188.A._10N.286.51.A6]YP_009817609.1 TMhelix containing protein [Vibrio phage 1.224.A._10N.261.48.B1]YP_009817695.1 TMhelix containing protein [Vibrio phage 1.261.O._10N.286.51.A7]AUR93663.1 TMhelix containing protein [Vibrio phage 1.188.B._10N.286.51.A6]AUR93749.1 TMhelix containing protein [Vibrio phage 1.188.C._10N.286.51.A6]AUR92052.1 TMhelix containing protein [Vibr
MHPFFITHRLSIMLFLFIGVDRFVFGSNTPNDDLIQHMLLGVVILMFGLEKLILLLRYLIQKMEI